MKIKVLSMFLSLNLLGFTACEETKKKQEEKAKTEQREAKRQADLKAGEDLMEMEANSIATKAMETDSLSTFMNALKKANLATTFTEDEGPYTVFVPTNSAFEQVEQDTLDKLMESENREQLSSLLKYHVVNEEMTSADLEQMIKSGNGVATFSTMEGSQLKAVMEGDRFVIQDENGNKATIIATDIEASNGIFHQIDAVIGKKSLNK